MHLYIIVYVWLFSLDIITDYLGKVFNLLSRQARLHIPTCFVIVFTSNVFHGKRKVEWFGYQKISCKEQAMRCQSAYKCWCEEFEPNAYDQEDTRLLQKAAYEQFTKHGHLASELGEAIPTQLKVYLLQ
jgi:hypothetical protein